MGSASILGRSTTSSGKPEVGLVMVRGRAGGTGMRFNLGELPVTRCSVRLDVGAVGHAWVGGRDLRHAELAAVFDALLQDEARRPGLETKLIGPLAAFREAARLASAAPLGAHAGGVLHHGPGRGMTMRAGLADPVLDAQGIFRSVLDALAHPGRVVTVPSALEPPAPLGPATAAVCLTLLDFETPLWLDPAARTPEVLEYLRFHCGVPICQSPRRRAFAVLADAAPSAFRSDAFRPAAMSIRTGRPRSSSRPARSSEGVGRRLTGPGIDGERRLDLEGVSGRFWDMLRENQALFPRGIDVLVTAGPRAGRAAAHHPGGGLTCTWRSREASRPSTPRIGCSARCGAGIAAVPELSLEQIQQQLGLAVDRVMGEASLHDPGAGRARHQAGLLATSSRRSSCSARTGRPCRASGRPSRSIPRR